MRWTKLFLVIAFAALASGGSFECHSDNDDDDDDHVHISN